MLVKKVFKTYCFSDINGLGQREILINPDNLDFPTHLGGMSGSPVFKVRGNAYPEFLGVFSEGSDGIRGAYFCSHAQFLLPDGKLDFTRIPPR